VPVIISERLTAIEGHAESLLTEKYTTSGGKNQEYLFILREIDGIENWIKKKSKDLQTYQKIVEVLKEDAPPELILKRIKRIISEDSVPCMGRPIPTIKKIKDTNKKYAFDPAMLSRVLDKTIDLFLKYEYESGFEEPRARERAIIDIMGIFDQGTGAVER